MSFKIKDIREQRAPIFLLALSKSGLTQVKSVTSRVTEVRCMNTDLLCIVGSVNTCTRLCCPAIPNLPPPKSEKLASFNRFLNFLLEKS